MTPMPLLPGCVINCRPIGMLEMEDESGTDEKLVAVPNNKIFPMYKNISSVRELPDLFRDQIQHFFEHYKDLEQGKWVKIGDWMDAETARGLISDAIERAKPA